MCALHSGSPDGSVDEEDRNIWMLGYGTLLQNESRETTLRAAGMEEAAASNDEHAGSRSSEAYLVRLRGTFGYRRAFCFRSSTGFTALGLVREDGSSSSSSRRPPPIDSAPEETTQGELQDIACVLFRVTPSQLAVFDRRERGYFRLPVPLDALVFAPSPTPPPWPLHTPDPGAAEPNPSLNPNRVYVYIPEEPCLAVPNEEYPILQVCPLCPFAPPCRIAFSPQTGILPVHTHVLPVYTHAPPCDKA